MPSYGSQVRILVTPYRRTPSPQTIEGCVYDGLMNTELGKLIGTKLFSNESRFNLWDHNGHTRVRRYAGDRCLLECVIERHSGLTPIVRVWGAISYHGRSDLL
ncbi:uncharacterized protein TNCV_325361 [Trichonephila clavipes]|nr:uncharacterized protein TNCV_325361 [Trichonephila clavipes]